MSTSSTNSRKTILDEAASAVDGSRQENYGHPAINFSRIAEYWTTHLKSKLNGSALLPEDVAAMMILLKVARLANSPSHRDSIVDIAGYARTIELIPEYFATKPIPVKNYR
jgi:hypothetical protein